MSMTDGSEIELHNPADMPDVVKIEEIREPWIRASILTPDEYLGAILKLCQERRGLQVDLSYVGSRAMVSLRPAAQRGGVRFLRPAEVDLQGLCLFRLPDHRPSALAIWSRCRSGQRRAGRALSMLVHRVQAEDRGRAMCEKLKELIPRHMFKIPIQAAIGGKVIARETLSAMRKDVTAKCYGGDVTRKRKLLDKQKAGKKKMRQFGRGRNSAGSLYPGAEDGRLSRRQTGSLSEIDYITDHGELTAPGKHALARRFRVDIFDVGYCGGELSGGDREKRNSSSSHLGRRGRWYVGSTRLRRAASCAASHAQYDAPAGHCGAIGECPV